MRYDDPKLRELLAGRYVLGTMPKRARARFERLTGADATIAREVGDWAERFAPIDEATPPVEPPAGLWRRIEADIGAPATGTRQRGGWPLWSSLNFWRGFAGLATAVAAAAIVYLGVFHATPPIATPNFIAVLNDKNGAPAWIATTGDQPDRVFVEAVGRQTIDAGHSFQLWAIAGGPPRPLGLLSPRPNQHLALASMSLPPTGGVLAVSLEPAGGSPTGKPTGPVLFQGKVFSNPL
jgi:anti-sigma-K factor RskA